MKKIFSIIILIAIIFTSFCSCSKKPIIIEDDDQLNFFGGKLVIAEGAHINHFPITNGSSSSGDRELTRYAEVEKEFNLTFDYLLNIYPGTLFLSAALAGNELQVDLLYAQNKHVYEAYLVNSLIPAAEIINDPTSEKWRTPSQNGCGFYGGKQYGIYPNYWETAPNLTGFIMLNMTLLEQYNINDPHEQIEAGEWDWEHFRSFLEATEINDPDFTWKGMVLQGFGMGAETIMPFLLANGAKYVVENNGRWTCELNSPEAIAALEYVHSLANDGLLVNNWPSSSNGSWLAYSGNGLSSDSTFVVCGIRYPYGPNGNKDIVSSITTHERIWSFPIFSAYSEEEIGTLAETLFSPLSEQFPNGWKDVVEDKYFFNHEDFEYFVRSAQYSEYIDNSILEDSFWELCDVLKDCMHGLQSPEIAIPNLAEFIQQEVDEQYNR